MYMCVCVYIYICMYEYKDDNHTIDALFNTVVHSASTLQATKFISTIRCSK